MTKYLVIVGDVPCLSDGESHLIDETPPAGERFRKLTLKPLSGTVEKRSTAVEKFVDENSFTEDDVIFLRGSLRDGSMMMFTSHYRKNFPKGKIYLLQHTQDVGWNIGEI